MSLVDKFFEDAFFPYEGNYMTHKDRSNKPHPADYFIIKILHDDDSGIAFDTGYVGDDSTPDDIKRIDGSYSYGAMRFPSREEAAKFIDEAGDLEDGSYLKLHCPTIFPSNW